MAAVLASDAIRRRSDPSHPERVACVVLLVATAPAPAPPAMATAFKRRTRWKPDDGMHAFPVYNNTLESVASMVRIWHATDYESVAGTTSCVVCMEAIRSRSAVVCAFCRCAQCVACHERSRLHASAFKCHTCRRWTFHNPDFGTPRSLLVREDADSDRNSPLPHFQNCAADALMTEEILKLDGRVWVSACFEGVLLRRMSLGRATGAEQTDRWFSGRPEAVRDGLRDLFDKALEALEGDNLVYVYVYRMTFEINPELALPRTEATAYTFDAKGTLRRLLPGTWEAPSFISKATQTNF